MGGMLKSPKNLKREVSARKTYKICEYKHTHTHNIYIFNVSIRMRQGFDNKSPPLSTTIYHKITTATATITLITTDT